MSEKETLCELIKKHPLFSPLTEEEIIRQILSNQVTTVNYSANEKIYTNRNFKKAIGLVLSGKIKIFRQGNGSQVLINTLQSGSIFGVAALFGAKDVFVTEIISSTVSSVLFISAEACEHLIRTNSGFAFSYISFLSDRIRFLNKRISELSASNTERKFAKYLSESENSPALTMKQLASFLGIGRATLYRMIDSFSEDGLIAKDGKNIIVLDKKKLEKLI